LHWAADGFFAAFGDDEAAVEQGFDG